LLWGGVAWGAAAALLFWPAATPPAAAGPDAPPAEVLAEVEAIEEDLKEIEDIAIREQDLDLAKLVKELRQKAEQVKEQGGDLRAVLSDLSEMQTALAAQQARYNVPLVDEQMRALGESLTPAAALENIGKALEEAKYEQAADELEKLDDPSVDRKEASVVSERLSQEAAKASERGLSELSEAASDLAKGVKGDKGPLRRGARSLAKQARDQERLRRLQQLLALEMDRLKDCKSRCSSQMLAWLEQPKRKKDSQNQQGKPPGKGAGGPLYGPSTKTPVQRRHEELSGMDSGGAGDVEITHSPEGREQARRPPREVYQKYRRMSEAVLETEPIPLGHREIIRKYFELIHPERADGQ
jgi:hypothetical protein